MKTLTAKSVFESSAFYITILINGIIIFFSIYKDVSLFTFIVATLLLNSFSYFLLSSEFYQIQYDDKKLIVTNSLKPFVYQEYKIVSLKKVVIGHANKHGVVLEIYSNNEMDLFGVNYIERDKLEKAVKEINKMIDKNLSCSTC